jgi:hypothetical protein
MPLVLWIANYILENYVSVEGISVNNLKLDEEEEENDTAISFSMPEAERGTVKLFENKVENDEREFAIEILYNSKKYPYTHQTTEITEEKYNELLAKMKTIIKGYIQ